MKTRSPLLITAGVLVVLYGAAALRYEHFFSWYQFAHLFGDNATLGLVALGMTFVILSGGIDLSVGAVVALASLLVAVMVTLWRVPAALAMPLVVVLGAGFGAGQGWIISVFRLPPFLVTLAGMFLARGLALMLTAEKRLSVTADPLLSALGAYHLRDVTVPAGLFLLTFALVAHLAHVTRFGRAVYAIGGNEDSAVLMGLPVAATKVRVYALSGALAALGGVAQVIGSGAGDAAAAQLLELDAIAAVVIGGTLLSGGVGSVTGTLLGVLISGIIILVPIYQGNLNAWWTKIAIGLLLLAFILLQRVLHRR